MSDPTAQTAVAPAAPAPADASAASETAGGGFARQARRLARESLHHVLSLPMGIVTFTFVVTAWSTALGTLVVIIGFPLLVLTVAATRGLCWIERARAALLGEGRIPGAYRVRLPRRPAELGGVAGTWELIKSMAVDGQTWRDLLYSLLLLPIGIATFTVTVTGWATGLALATAPAWFWIPDEPKQWVDLGLFKLHDWRTALAASAIGLIALVLTALLVRGMAVVTGAVTRGLLGCERRDLEQRVERLTETRAGAVDAAHAELGRIERDLHDGAQARLVAVTMDLGRAEQRLADSGSDEASDAVRLVREARAEAQQALAELRDLARGMRPAMLAERGLGPAVTSLAARAGGVPATVEIGELGELPDQVETAAYFAVAEALANIAKHAEASSAQVVLERAADTLLVEVRDDGAGDADPRGTGIDGLRKRVEALDGTLSLNSPRGGPTTLRAELPCGS